MEEKPSHLSPWDYGFIEAGWTRKGFQVWCKRHELNILNIDCQGNPLTVRTPEEQEEDLSNDS